MAYSTTCASPVGRLTLASDGKSLTGLWLDGQKYHAATLGGCSEEKSDLPVFEAVRQWLDAYFSGENPAIFSLPLAPDGSEFRKTVWGILCEIPYGQCVTYGEIARKASAGLKRNTSGRAVGGAVGHNPISIIIPCHRVIGAGGKLTGYAGGIDRKVKLLQHEGIDTSQYLL